MKLLIFLILVLALYPIAYHWEDFKEFYHRFNNLDDQALVLTVHLIVCFLAVAGTVWFIAY